MKRAILFLEMFLLSICLLACAKETSEEEKIRDMEFTVLQEELIPKELVKLIEERKTNPFQLSYTDAEYLYIVVGYGEQATGGYSIAVNELYLTENAIYMDTDLLGPEKNVMVTQALTYPYVVVKTEYMEKSVVFR